MKIHKWVFIVIVFLLASFYMAKDALAANYYVSPSGNDSNPGTSTSQPWRTINKVNSTTFASADRILFQGGQTFGGNLYFDSSDAGSLRFPITITSYGAGRAVVNAGLGNGFYAYNVAGYRIQNINFVGAGRTSNTSEGILFYNDLPGNTKLSFIAISNVDVSGFGNRGISIVGYNNKSGFRYVQITDTVSHDNALAGIYIWGFFSSTLSGYAHQDIYIGNCKTYNNTGVSGLSSNSGSGIVVSNVDGATIERSVAYNNGSLNTANGGPIGIWAWDANNVVIQHNESHHNRTASATDGGGFDLDGGVTNSVMQYNYSHDNDGAGFLLAQFSGARPFSGNTVRYNISQNDGRKNGFAGIHLWNGGSGVKNSEIYNNTIFLSPAAQGSARAIYFQSPTVNVHVRNNIFVTTGGLRLVEVVTGQSGLLFQGNDYWASGASFAIRYSGVNYASLSAWSNATGQEKLGGNAVGLSLDPRLNNPGGGGTLNNADLLEGLTAYQLQDISPLIDAGLDLFTLFGINNGGVDFYSSTLPHGPAVDRGAHESQMMLPPGMQLLSDPGFENNGVGWQKATNGGRSIVSTQFYSGTKSLQMVVSNSFSRAVYQDIAVTGGETYDASAWVRTSGIVAAGAKVSLLWLNTAAGDPLPPGSVIRTDVVGTLGGVNGWTQLFGRYSAPTNAIIVRVHLSVDVDPDNSGTAWFDEINLSHP
jgi:hypothetical protein